MEAAAGIRPKITINGEDYDTVDGSCVRDYVHVTDLADAHVSAMDYIRSRNSSIQVNLGSETGISVREMLDEAIRVTGVNIRFDSGPRRPGDPAKLVASSEMARRLLGWRALRSDAVTLLSSTWSIYKP